MSSKDGSEQISRDFSIVGMEQRIGLGFKLLVRGPQVALDFRLHGVPEGKVGALVEIERHNKRH